MVLTCEEESGPEVPSSVDLVNSITKSTGFNPNFLDICQLLEPCPLTAMQKPGGPIRPPGSETGWN